MCDGDDDIDPEEEFRRSIAHLRPRVQKKRLARHRQDGRKALVRWLGRHNQYSRPMLLAEMVLRMRSPGIYCEVVFGQREPLPAGLYPDRMAELKEAIGGNDGS